MPKDVSALPVNQVRRADRAVNEDAWIADLLHHAPLGALATVSDGQPFININLLSIDEARRAIYMHTGRYGRTRTNVDEGERVCFSISTMGACSRGTRRSNSASSIPAWWCSAARR